MPGGPEGGGGCLSRGGPGLRPEVHRGPPDHKRGQCHGNAEHARGLPGGPRAAIRLCQFLVGLRGQGRLRRGRVHGKKRDHENGAAFPLRDQQAHRRRVLPHLLPSVRTGDGGAEVFQRFRTQAEPSLGLRRCHSRDSSWPCSGAASPLFTATAGSRGTSPLSATW